MVEGNETGEEGSNEQVSKNSVVLLRLAASPSCSSNELVQGSFETSFVSNDFSLSVCLPFLRDNEFSLIYRPSSFLRFEDLVDRRIDTILFSLMFDREIYRVDNFSTVYGGEEERLFGLIRKEVASFASPSSREMKRTRLTNCCSHSRVLLRYTSNPLRERFDRRRTLILVSNRLWSH